MTKVEELEIAIRKHLKECNVRESDPPRFVVLNEILEAIDAGRAEGAEQERKRIRSLATPIDDYASQMSLVIPYTALSPAPKEKP
jgi:hypothetical protein